MHHALDLLKILWIYLKTHNWHEKVFRENFSADAAQRNLRIEIISVLSTLKTYTFDLQN